MASILDIDPDLGAGLRRQDWRAAQLATGATTLDLTPGRWTTATEANTLLLIGSGLLIRELRLSDRIASELIGPGDIVDTAMSLEELVPADITWRVVTDSQVVVLTAELMRSLPPVVARNVVRSAVRRASRLGTAQAIAQLPRVDDRVLALFGHLAERWGHITADGVRLPLELTHETIGQLLGAARPTVSLALKGLAARAEIVPHHPGWLLSAPALERLRPQPAPQPISRDDTSHNRSALA